MEFIEGSLVYRGAYSGTKVGGNAASAQVVTASAALSGPTSQTRFQMAASRDMQAALEKADPAASSKPAAPTASAANAAPTQPQEEPTVKLNLKLPDGSVRELAADQANEVQALLDAQVTAAEQRGAQARLEAHATALGLEPKDATDTRLQQLAQEASEGRQYREDLLADLHALTLAVSGTGETAVATADRTKRAYATLSLGDIRAEVQRLTALRDGDVPAARLSVEVEEPREKPRAARADLDAV